MISDEEIIKAFRKSENEGYRKLIDSYGNYVYTVITDKVRGLAAEQDKEECAADVFIETVRECKKHDFTMDSLKAVITAVAKRKATDLFRKLYGRKQHNEYFDELNDEPTDYETPEHSAVSRSEKEMLWNEVLSLGKPDSDILILQFFHSKTAAEISKILKMTTASVNKRSQRAREKLKKTLMQKEVHLNG
ncbi:MAG: RNA polymerase sigma factor [Oscillospiraceae bacterium]